MANNELQGNIFSITNYSCESTKSSNNSDFVYNYWNSNALVRIIGDKYFTRGDLVEIYYISSPNESQCNIYCKVHGSRENVENLPEEITEEIPTILIASVRTPLDPNEEYTLEYGSNVKVIKECDSLILGNQYKTVVMLVTSDNISVSVVDGDKRRICEWVIRDD